MSLAIHFSQSFLGKVLLKIFSFICLPLLTYAITPDEMGVFQLLFGGLGIFVEIVSLGMRQVYAIDFFKRTDLKSRLELIAQNLFVYFKISSFLFLAFYFFLINYLPSEYRKVTVIAMIYAYLNLFNELFLNTVRYQQKFFFYNSLCLAVGFCQFLLTLLFVIFFKWHLLGLSLAYLVTEGVFLVVVMALSRRELQLLRRLKRIKMQNVLFQALPFIPSVLSFWLLMNIDQWMLLKMLGLESVGMYAIAAKLSLLFDYFITSTFLLVYTPKAFSLMKKSLLDGVKQNTSIAVCCLVASFIIGAMTWFFAPLLKYVISSHYDAAIPLIAPLMVAASLRFSSGVLQLTLQYRHQISFLVVANLLVALINVALNYLLIPLYGINGCLLATNISFFCLFFLILWRQETGEPALC